MMFMLLMIVEILLSIQWLQRLDAAHKEILLRDIPQRFISRKFVAEIVMIPDYYLKGKSGFEGLAGVQRLYGVDLMAEVDPTTHALLLRAGGINSRNGTSALIRENRDLRAASSQGFSAATQQMIDQFDSALTKFESDVREGKSSVKVVSN